VLYAPTRGLGPGYISLAVLETIGVAVIARLRSIPAATVAGLIIGVIGAVGQSVSGSEPKLVTNLFIEIFVVATVVFLMVYRNLDEIGSVGSTAALVTSTFGARGRNRALPMAGVVIAVLVAFAPTVLSVSQTHSVQKILAYTVVFLSVVAITGFSGHITLATAFFAGLGAYTSARIENGYLPWFTSWQPLPHVPPLLAMFIAALLLVPFGVLIGYPALRRKGLILALLTLAVAQVGDKLIFQEPLFTDRGMTPRRPNIGGWSFNGDKMFTVFELAILGFALLLARNLRSGTLGRALGAMRDSENGSTSVGISLRRYKLIIFGASAFLAGLGGALIAQQARAVDLSTGGTFSPLEGLFWFTAVVVGGLSYLSGAPVAAALFVLIDQFTGQDQSGLFVIGLLGIFIGYLPGGVVGTASRLTRGGILRRSLQSYLEAEAERRAQPPPGTGLEPTAFARELVGAAPSRGKR
jgi:branched-chain amino acid transport system permease protein